MQLAGCSHQLGLLCGTCSSAFFSMAKVSRPPLVLVDRASMSSDMLNMSSAKTSGACSGGRRCVWRGEAFER